MVGSKLRLRKEFVQGQRRGRSVFPWSLLLKFGGRLVIQRAVQPSAIVECLDVIEEGPVDLCRSEPRLAVNELGFKRAEERFHAGVVVAVARRAHAGEHLMVLEQLAIIGAGILAAAVGMVQEARRRSAPAQSALERLLDERSFEVVSRGPAHDLAAAQVHDGGQIKPALGGGNVGDVAHPHLVGFAGCNPFFEPVGRDWQWVIAVGGARAKGPFLQSAQAVMAHESSNAMAAATVILLFERLSHARAAIGFAGRSVDLHNERQQLVIGPLALAGLAFEPGIVAAAGEAEHLTDLGQRKFHRESFHLGIPFCGGSSESMPRDFFRISRWVVTRSRSRRSCWFSINSCSAVMRRPRCSMASLLRRWASFQSRRALKLTPNSLATRLSDLPLVSRSSTACSLKCASY